ncbi:phtf [Drosophila busckii]|uniref:Phtf n=1 Tax=Drosophila busckii TaxID=30019 RepID=A0A0M3QVC5_DROBS|nr:putative homeodomain transcription factor [Drosophila busckii]XP_017839712.1 putative homeodomain transcription factor [Drosophila busckii]ALC42179.1 phtf [Drosophila busckii]
MKLDEIVAWYQKKIGTYDKQEWEKTVEQRILDGFNSVNLKNTKLKTELIDVDLVRGSTFPKAKPKQTLLTVIRLAILRYLLLPLYAQWWVKQTTPNAFGLILCLYITQLINWGIYVINSDHIAPLVYDSNPNVTLVEADAGDKPHPEENVDLLSALLIPCALSLLISLIHSQIVATNSSSGSNNKNKLRKFSLSSYNDKPNAPREQRLRRRKKFVRIRQPETEVSQAGGSHGISARRAKLNHLNQEPSTSSNNMEASKLNCCNCSPTSSEETFQSTTAITMQHQAAAADSTTHAEPLYDLRQLAGQRAPESPHKKRNVNWHTPIQICATFDQNEMPTSSNEMHNLAAPPAYHVRRSLGEDDGFESLNGKSSSGEDNNLSPNVDGNTNAPTTVNTPPSTLRLRLNVNSSSGNNANTSSNLTANEKASRETSSSCAESDECDDADIISSPASAGTQECNTSATDWLGVTTNSEDCSYTSELEQSDGGFKHTPGSDEELPELDITPTTILNPHSSLDRISCTIWDQRDTKKAQMSVLEIASCIIERVDSLGVTNDYIYIGVVFSVLLTLIPIFCRLCEITIDADKSSELSYFYIPQLLWEKSSASIFTLMGLAFGQAQWERTVLVLGFVQRLCLTLILFIIFAVAERTFKQRFLYAKLFSHLTSSRRARKSSLPHFRLNKVRNIKTWLSVRSYLKKRGPQRSVDIIVSAAFIVTLLLLAFLSVEWLKDSVHLHTHLTLEALIWSITIGIYLLRFMTLGQKIQHKYRSVSVLITEQINLYLQIEQKPKKKEELMVSNSVLKLAADLLKELETPFKISGLSANPYLFTTIKVVILSALSGVLSEVLGFKLKLHKIKIK